MTVNDFRKKVNDEIKKLNELCNIWNALSVEDENIPENIIGEISVCCGKAQLLINGRINQFTRLINDCENKSSEKEIRISDLQAFWDLIFLSLEDVFESFNNLEKMKNNDWKIIAKEIEKIEKPTKIIRKPLINYSKIRPTFRRPKTQLKPVNK